MTRRATKDIDLLQALATLPGSANAMPALLREWMDKGHSTALEGEMLEHVPVVTLDVNGMLLTQENDAGNGYS